jgi:hypothetical protein
MNHTEFESEFRAAIEDIFKKQDEYIVDQCKHDKRFRIDKKIFRNDLCSRNAKDKDEILAERDTVIGLYEEKARDELSSHESPRLQALKAVQKKIKFSIEKHELELLKNYWSGMLLLALLAFILLTTFASDFPRTELIQKINLITVQATLGFFMIRTVFELGGKSILILQKRCLEIVEQAIELAQAHELTKV